MVCSPPLASSPRKTRPSQRLQNREWDHKLPLPVASSRGDNPFLSAHPDRHRISVFASSHLALSTLSFIREVQKPGGNAKTKAPLSPTQLDIASKLDYACQAASSDVGVNTTTVNLRQARDGLPFVHHLESGKPPAAIPSPETQRPTNLRC